MPSTRSNQNDHPAHRESGVAIFYILIAVVLFAALAYVFSLSMVSSASNLTKEEARVHAQDLISYASRLSRGVQRVMSRGVCSENDISFYLSTNALLAAYQHTPEVDDLCKVFHEDGGTITWLTAPEGVNDGSDWLFTGHNRLHGLNSDTAATGNELLALLMYIDEAVCLEINELVGITNTNGTPPLENNGFRTDLFTGPFLTSTGVRTLNDEILGRETGCIEATSINGSADADTFHFYHVLVAR